MMPWRDGSRPPTGAGPLGGSRPGTGASGGGLGGLGEGHLPPMGPGLARPAAPASQSDTAGPDRGPGPGRARGGRLEPDSDPWQHPGSSSPFRGLAPH